MKATQYNPAAEGFAAAKADDERRAKIEQTWPGRNASDAITFACAAQVAATSLHKKLTEVIDYFERGELLAAVGTFDGAPNEVTEIAVLMRLISKAAQR